MSDRPVRSINKQEAAVAAVLGLLTWLVFFRTPTVVESLDWQNYYRANFHFLLETLRAGDFPWWNPHIGLGRPFASDIQNAIWYPGTYLLLLGETPGLFSLIWTHLTLAALGTRRVAIEFGAESSWATLAGLVFALSGPLGMRLFPGQVFFVFGLCYLPILLLFWHRLLTNPDPRSGLWFALLLATQFFTGHPQAAWITLAGLGVYGGISLTVACYGNMTNAPVRSAIAIGAAILLAALITGIGWMPMLDLIEHGNRTEPDLKFSSFGQVSWIHIFGWVHRPPIPHPLSWEMNSFMGFGWTIPFLLGVFLLRDTQLKILMLSGAILFCFAFGSDSIFFHIFFKLIPGTSSFRLPGRMLIWPVLAVAIVSAVVLSRNPPERLPKYLISAITAVVGICLILNYPAQSYDGSDIPLYAPLFKLAAAVAATSIVWTVRLNQWPAWWAIASLTTITAFEFTFSVRHYHHMYAVGTLVGTKPDQQLANQAVKFVSTIKERRNDATPVRTILPMRIIPSNDAMIRNFQSVDAYTSLFLRRPWKAVHELSQISPDPFRNSGLSDGLYGIHPFGVPSVSVDLGVMPGTSELIINTNPPPRAWFSTAWFEVDSSAGARQMIARGFPFPGCALVEREQPTPSQVPTKPMFAPAKIENYGHNEVKVSVQAPSPGYLVLNDAWFPGWTAVIDGREQPTEPVNAWMRGIPLAAGDHNVLFRFRPRRWMAGVSLTLLGLSILIWGFYSQHPGGSIGTPKTIESSADDATGKSSTFPAGKQT